MRTFVTVLVLVGLVPQLHAQRGTPFFRLNGLNVEADPVKGAPYSAEVITDSVQTLADGNRIVQHTTARVYRDGDGRTRREEDRPSGEPAVTITDPIAQRSWSLDAENHIARQSPALPRGFSLTVSDELKRRELAQVTALFNGAPFNFAVGPNGRGGPAAAGEQHSEERLAPRTLEGVRVEGVRRTTTIAAGAIGNERPLVSTSEEWTSPELKMLVLSEYSDPRTGTSTYKLVNVKRGDPPAWLFQVPPDYTVQTVVREGVRGAAPPR